MFDVNHNALFGKVMIEKVREAGERAVKAVRRMKYTEPRASSGMYCDGHREGFIDAEILASRIVTEIFSALEEELKNGNASNSDASG